MRPSPSLIALLLLLAVPASAKEWSQPDLKFRFSTPDDFESMPADGNTLFQFTRPVGKQDDVLVISVQRLHGKIGREPLILNPRYFPPGAKVTQQKVTWSGFPLDEVRSEFSLSGMSVVGYEVQVPLIPEAIQLVVMGPITKEAETRDAFRKLLASVQGSTDWLTDEERVVRVCLWVGKNAGGLVFLLGLVFLISRRKRLTSD